MKTPSNPSSKAIARVKDKLPIPTFCKRCGGTVRVVTHSEIYNGASYGEWPWAYCCSGCGDYVGMHPFTNIPLGTLADKETRSARKECKAYFNRLMESKVLDRATAYKMLANKLGIPVNECHFAWFTVNECQLAKQACISLEFENV